MLENLFVVAPSRSIEHSVNLCFKQTASMFLKFFCSPVLLYELKAVGQLLSHPKDKLALKFLLPVLNLAELFFCLFCFLDLLHPLKTTTKRKMHTPIQQMTDKPIVIILKKKTSTLQAHEQNKLGGKLCTGCMFVIVAIILQPVALHTLQISLAVQARLQKAFFEKFCMNQKGF